MIDRFANDIALQLLWLLPVLWFLSWFLIRQSAKKLNQNLGSKIASVLAASLSTKKRKFKAFLEIAALLFFIVALARPQSGQSQQEVKSEGVEVMLLVDVSQSMMAEDVRPSRLDLAKKELIRFLDFAGGDRVGLIAFAGSAALLSPVTTDKSALKMFIESLTTESVSTQGTEFRKALEQANSAFSRGGIEAGEESVVTRVILIASDGEDNEQGALEIAEELADRNVRIFTLAFGTEKGAPIPLRDPRGNLMGYKKDSKNQVVMTSTKGTVLKNLAQVGKGSFHHVTFGGDAIRRVKDEIRGLEQSLFESSQVTNYDESYQSFLFLGLFLALVELLLGERRSQGRVWKGRFEVKS